MVPRETRRWHAHEDATNTEALSESNSFDEADDERSSISYMRAIMPHRDPSQSHVKARYPGEDTRLTSQSEIRGWYSYGFAAEVFIVCGVGSFIPITLEQLARERGVLLSDKSSPCRPSSKSIQQTPQFGSNARQCIIQLLGAEINTASFAMYTFSLSVFFQALLIVSMSGAADHGTSRKSMLVTLAVTGAVATMLFLAIVPKVYLLGALLAIVSNTCSGASFVLLNSFLPLLVRYHPSTQKRHPLLEFEGRQESVMTDDHESDTGEAAASLLAICDHEVRSSSPTGGGGVTAEMQLSTRISAYGIGIGYIAAVIVQTLAIVTVLTMGSTTFSLRVAIFIIGLWWLIFTIPAGFWLRPRPGPPLFAGIEGMQRRSWSRHAAHAWRSLGTTLLQARQLKDVVLFLAAWFLLSDGIATVSSTAVMFGKVQLSMQPAALALVNIVSTLSGIFGAFSWGWLSRRLKLRPNQTIIACICLLEVIPLYGMLGFIPAVKRLGVFGLQTPVEMYPLGAVYGFVLGGLSSYCRSLFGELIPPNYFAAFYSLYAITDKSSSVFGPAVVGAITDRYGDIRPAFVFLAVLIFVPIPLMILVDVDRGKEDGARMARELERNETRGLHDANASNERASTDEADQFMEATRGEE